MVQNDYKLYLSWGHHFSRTKDFILIKGKNKFNDLKFPEYFL